MTTAMDPKPASEQPGLRSIEITTQDARSGRAPDGELFLDLRIEFTTRPNGSLRVLDLGEDFDVDIEGQLVYQIGGDPDISEDTLEVGDDGMERQDALGVNEVGPTSNEDTQSMESSTDPCRTTTPKRLCTRETVLTPASTKRRLFPPSPLSDCSEHDNMSSIFDEEEDKENKEPGGMDLSTSPCPPYGHKKRVTAVRVPRTPTFMDDEEQLNQPLEDSDNNLARPLTPSHKVEVPTRSPSPSKIPIKTSKPFATPDKKPSNADNSLLLARTPETPSGISKLRAGLSRLEVPKPVTEPGHSRRKTVSPEWSRFWQGAEADDNLGRGSSIKGKNGVQDEYLSSSVPRQNLEKGHLQQFDGPPESPFQERAKSPFRTSGKAMAFEHHDRDRYDFFGSPREVIDIPSQHRPSSEDSFVLQSPSTSSQFSMPWNSAEDLIPEYECASQSPRQPLASKILPVLEHDHGLVYMAFPKDVMEGVFVCDATLHFKVSVSDYKQEVDIRCATAGLREPFSLKWGAQYSPTKSFVPAPKLSLVKRAVDVPVKAPASEVLIDVGPDEGSEKARGGEAIQTQSDSQGEEAIQSALEEDLDDSHAPNFEDVAAHFRVLLIALGDLLSLSGAILVDKLRSLTPRWIGSWTRNRGQWRQWGIGKWLLFFTIVFIMGMIFMFDEQCQTEYNDPMYAFHAFRAGYNPEVHRFRPLEPSESCTRWIRGMQAIQGLFRDDDMDRGRFGGIYSTTPAYVGRTKTARERNSMKPRRSGATAKTAVPTLTSIKEVEVTKKTQVESESDIPSVPDFRCRQIRTSDLENVTCVVNDTCSVIVPRSAHHEEGFTWRGWMKKHHPEVLGLSPEDAEESSQEKTTEAEDEAQDVSTKGVKKELDEKEEKKDAGKPEIPTRDKIDYFLGWRGLN